MAQAAVISATDSGSSGWAADTPSGPLTATLGPSSITIIRPRRRRGLTLVPAPPPGPGPRQALLLPAMAPPSSPRTGPQPRPPPGRPSGQAGGGDRPHPPLGP